MSKKEPKNYIATPNFFDKYDAIIIITISLAVMAFSLWALLH